ncbi:MAG: hypothetical protein LBG19_07720 [Prevotellaceae bacterium]|jgi:hypothetical protein|nr:hypothetical protein [Prevotellaceae bacterium]
MNEQKEKLMQLVNDLKEYINVRLKILTLTICEVSSKVLASLIANGSMLLFIFLFLIFGSIAAGFGLGEWLGSTASGFAIIAGFYLLLALIIQFSKAKLIEKPLVNTFIKLFLKNLSDNSENKENEDEKN